MRNSSRFVSKPLRHLLPLMLGLLMSFDVSAQDRNTVHGDHAGAGITTGDDNVVYGHTAGYALSTGSDNIIIGSQAGIGVLSEGFPELLEDVHPVDVDNWVETPFNGTANIMIGFKAGWQSTGTFTQSIHIGYLSGQFSSGSENTFFGYGAGRSNTTGNENVIIGADAGEDNTTGFHNVFVGRFAGHGNTTGFRNVYLGEDTGLSAETGWYNVGVGVHSLYAVNGWLNTAIGALAGRDTNEGIMNTFLGEQAGTQNREAHFNTFVGAHAGWNNNVTGSRGQRNTYVGANAQSRSNSSSIDDHDNAIVGAFAGSNLYNANRYTDSEWSVTGISQFLPHSSSRVTSGRKGSRRTGLGANARIERDDSMALGFLSWASQVEAIAIGATANATHQRSAALGVGAESHGNDIFVLGSDQTTSIEPAATEVTALGSLSFRYADTFATTAKTSHRTGNAGIDFVANNRTDLISETGPGDADHWRMEARDQSNLVFRNATSGALVDVMTITPAGNVTVTGNVHVRSDGRLKQQVVPIQEASALVGQLAGHGYEWRDAPGRPGTHYGFLAQEVEEVVPELVQQRSGDTFKTVNYQGVLPLLVESVKSLQGQNERLMTQRKRQTEELNILREQSRLLEEELKLQDELLNRLSTDLKEVE